MKTFLTGYNIAHSSMDYSSKKASMPKFLIKTRFFVALRKKLQLLGSTPSWSSPPGHGGFSTSTSSVLSPTVSPTQQSARRGSANTWQQISWSLTIKPPLQTLYFRGFETSKIRTVRPFSPPTTEHPGLPRKKLLSEATYIVRWLDNISKSQMWLMKRVANCTLSFLARSIKL